VEYQPQFHIQYISKTEVFLGDGVLYRRRSNDDHQLIVAETLVRVVIKQNHDPVYVTQPGTKRTHDLIASHYC